ERNRIGPWCAKPSLEGYPLVRAVLACAWVRSASDTAEDEPALDGSEESVARESTVATDYGADYYGNYTDGGIVYERSPFWLDFFRKIADRLIDDFHPTTMLDAGCAIGL